MSAHRVSSQEATVQPPAAVSAIYTPPCSGFQALRVKLIAPPQIPSWVEGLVRLAQDDPWVDIELEVDRAIRIPEVQGIPVDARVSVLLEHALRRRLRHSHPLRPVPAPARSRSEWSDSGHRGQGPDLVLLLGDGGRAQAVAAGRSIFGTWRIDASLLDPMMGGVDLLGPMTGAEDATAVVLELTFPGQPAIVLERSSAATSRDAFALQRMRVLRKLSSLVLRALRRLAKGQIKLPATDAVATLRLATPRVRFGTGLRAMSQVASRFLARRMREAVDGQQWSLVVREGGALLDPRAPETGPIAFLASHAGRSWADPCVVQHGGRTHVFFEEFGGDLERGHIACQQLSPGEALPEVATATVLAEPWHLSYPQPFHWRGHWYMTVESKQSRRVSVYRADVFPSQWRHEVDLLTGRACVDPTLFEHEGVWYLFTGVSEEGSGTCDELFLFVGESPLGLFVPHPCNPIVVDVRHARPAGRIFKRGERLYRPAQNCAPSYGAELAFQEITALTPTTYAERNAGVLSPWAPEIDGCHTYSQAAGIEVLDARSSPGKTAVRPLVRSFASPLAIA